jgi:hypothetical protein
MASASVLLASHTGSMTVLQKSSAFSFAGCRKKAYAALSLLSSVGCQITF